MAVRTALNIAASSSDEPANGSVNPMEPLQSSTVICTLGMHRSGTSLASRLLNLLGVDLGPAQAIAQVGYDNPKGYWEHNRLALINDEILARYGGRWDEPPVFPAGWQYDSRLDDLRQKATAILADDFAAAPVWGWKDPRTCLTVPFWQDLLGPMRYVICVRNPSAVLASLGRRNSMSEEKAERLWLAHVQSSLAHTSGCPRLFVFYENIINDCETELQRMAAFIGRPERAQDPRVRASVSEFLEANLCHHRLSMEDLAGNRHISFASKGLYLAMRTLAPRGPAPGGPVGSNGDGSSVERTLDLLATGALETWDRTAAIAAERESFARDNRTHTAALGALTLETDRARASAGTLSIERDRLIAEANRSRSLTDSLSAERNRLAVEVSDATAQIQSLSADRDRRSVREQDWLQSKVDLESALQATSEQRDHQAREYEASRRELQDIHASCAWRMLTFSRRWIIDLLPSGTRRRQIFDTVVRRLARRADVALHRA